jgi:hypothetical protein
MLRIGIVGLPNAGKSTLFNALTRAGALVGSYPFTTVEPNVGIVEIPDRRLPQVAHLAKADKITYATIEYFDIAGLVKGAWKGEGLGNKFLGHIRECDAIAHVARCFENKDVIHIEGSVDPARDLDIVNTELILADLQTVDKAIQKAEPMLKTGEKRYRDEIDVLKRLKTHLSKGILLRSIELAEEERNAVARLFLLTAKPAIIVLNIDEAQVSELPPLMPELFEEQMPAKRGMLEAALQQIRKIDSSSPLAVICAELDNQLAELGETDAAEYLAQLGLDRQLSEHMVEKCYKALDLISFFTMKGTETRAWSIPKGTHASVAAGKIHTDMERGFIKADVINFGELEKIGSYATAKEHGKIRSEGRDYEIKDADIVLIKFNV